MGRTFSRYVNTLTDIAIRDTQCGFKAFHTPVARLLFHCMVINRFAFDVELLYTARRLHFDIAEVPIHWRDVPGSAVRPVMDPLSMAVDVLRMRLGRKSPLIPALSVPVSVGSDSADTVHALLADAFGRTLPIVELEPDRVDVLLPLSNEEGARRVRSRIDRLLPDADVQDRQVDLADLIEPAQRYALTRGPAGRDGLGNAEETTPSGTFLPDHDDEIHQDQKSLPLPGA